MEPWHIRWFYRWLIGLIWSVGMYICFIVIPLLYLIYRFYYRE